MLPMSTTHRIVFGNCRSMKEIPDESIQLMVTSPPYYNAPFDYPNMFKDYDEFLGLIRDFSQELYRVMAPGRIGCIVADDMLEHIGIIEGCVVVRWARDHELD